jgi:hypothetical protein
MSAIGIFERAETSGLASEVIKDGKLIAVPYSVYQKYDMNTIRTLMFDNGFYVLPTTELIEFLKDNIAGEAIEIGAGHGAIGRALHIPITDIKRQERPEVITYYKSIGQPITKYPKDVEQMDALIAVDRYRPDTVIGAFITWKWNGRSGPADGVDERKLLQAVKRYIHIGNLVTHSESAILNVKHEEHYFDWLITRAQFQKENRVFIF